MRNGPVERGRWVGGGTGVGWWEDAYVMLYVTLLSSHIFALISESDYVIVFLAVLSLKEHENFQSTDTPEVVIVYCVSLN